MAGRRKNVLIVAADEDVRERLTAPLKRDYRVLRAASGESALTSLERDDIDVVIADEDLAGISGLDLLRITRANYQFIETILVSSATDFSGVVDGLKAGAFHYLRPNVDPDLLRAIVGQAAEQQDQHRRLTTLETQVQDVGEREFVSGNSRLVQEVMETVQKVARLPATVLILGESGTGKELLARMIHRDATRQGGATGSERRFVAVNLAAIPRDLVESTLFGHERGAFTGALQQRIGTFEQANGGTLFLDEIGDLRLDLQAKLLRAVQEQEIERVGGSKPIRTSFRLLAATHVDLQRAVREGTFRGDLFYRLNVVPVRLPPLRDRLEDVPVLAEFFLRRYNARFGKEIKGIADSTLRMLSQYWWPGNIRELENLVERVVATCDSDWITDNDLPVEFRVPEVERTAGEGSVLDRSVATFERNLIVRALEVNRWNVTRTARYLGVPLSTLKFKINRHEVRDIARQLRSKD